MTKKTALFIALTIFTFLATGQANAQTAKPAKEYLNVPGPVVFEKTSFRLDWSAHPSPDFYKQEYLAKGDTTGKYKTILLLDVIVGDVNIKDVVAQKTAELKRMKETNPMVNFESFGNPTTGEYMLDFLLSANSADGKYVTVVERNVYRYKTFTDKSGKKGILLFGVSTRSYGNDIDAFLLALKNNKKDLVNQVAKFTIPEIKIAK
ncbi:hypothetical protein [Ferruginibacter sp.]